MFARRSLRPMRRSGAANLAAPVTTSISPTSATQWDGATVLTVNGANFTASSVIYIDGVTQSTTFVNSTQVTCTIAAAETAGSPLQVAGSKSVRVDSSNTQTFTVNAWDFTDAGTVTLLLDAANVTLNGATVSSWNDTSGSGRHATQGTAANQPTYVATHTWNNRPAISFDGSNDILTTSAAMSTMITNSAYTAFIVFSATAIDTNAANVYANDALILDTVRFFGALLKSAPTVHSYNWDSNADSNSHNIATSTNYVFTMRHNSGNLESRLALDAVTQAASGNTGNVTGQLQIGGHSGGGQYFQGYMGHVVILNSSITDANMDRAVRKLTVYYGM